MTEIINNRDHRIELLKNIIHSLHEGADPAEVEAKLKSLVKETDSSEIAAMEQQLIEDGMPVEKIQAMCDMHSQVLRDIIVERRSEPVASGHPVDTFKQENIAIGKAADAFSEAFEKLCDGDDDSKPSAEVVHQCQHLFNELMDVDKHYQRKENLLFSYLERHNITGPSKVMWGKDDEVRDLLKAVGETLAAEGAAAGEWKVVKMTVVDSALSAVREMIYKEENILLPMAMETLTEMEWGEVYEQSPEFGWCLVDPGDEYQAPKPVVASQSYQVVKEVKESGIALNVLPDTPAVAPKPTSEAIIFPTGSMSLAQLKGIFATLPVDITFVDADDRVRFFSEGETRIFARAKAIIGRKVQHCHPPSSVNVVEQIVADFKSGKEDSCEFWINFEGKFVHIKYFAVRDEAGAYLGTLEVTQDAAPLRALEGERRLLEYDSK